jgi:hypothetical protein
MPKHDTAQEQAEACFGVFASAVAQADQARGRTHGPANMIAAWSLAHGLATLALEGALDKSFGCRATRANVAAVFQASRAAPKAME